jgi:BirA family biotin operon repressor/biotin-[acetyl-CoA-carboxylase] ligase
MYKDRILKLLSSSRPGFVSGEELAAKMGISRTMVWKHVKSLEREGFGIEAVPSRGYRITSVPDVLRIADIRQGLSTEVVGREIILLPEVASTNTLAMELASEGAAEGTVVLAETQTAGKGRLGRTWISPRGNIYMSVILRPDVPVHKAPLITLMGAVAAASAVRSGCGLAAAIKWPNDLMLSAKKVCGLLTEMSAEPDRVRHIVLGLGVNVNMDRSELPPDLQSTATTLASEAGRRIDRTALLRQILRDLDRWYRVFVQNDDGVLNAWESLNETTGNRVSVSGPRERLEGLARGIDSEGRLIVQLDDGSMRTVAAGDVTILKGTRGT